MAISENIRQSPTGGPVRPYFSCVMADGPRFVHQTLTLVWTLLDLALVEADRIVVHVLEGTDPQSRQRLEALGIVTRSCRPFREGHPHCNKLRQLEDAHLLDAEHVVLCDTDLAFVHPITDALSTNAIRAKVVDLPNPPLDDWTRILAAAGLPGPPTLTHTSFGDHTTPSFNCNGGLYLLPGPTVRPLAEAWPRWAAWLIDRPALLPGGLQVHVDQVAFGLATAELGLSIDLLPLEWNFPTHDVADPKPNLTPHVLHYHDRVDSSGFIRPVLQPNVDAAIARVNEVIAARRRESFDNTNFWDFRYRQAPDLGSGVGSRGVHLQYKRDLLARLVEPADSVLDVGCGDLEVSRDLPVRSFTGIDLSAEALTLARTKKPEWTFLRGAVADLPLEAHDVVVCFDVLIHQRTTAAYRSLVADLVRLATKTLVIGAYNQPPWHESEITFYHEPLSATLSRLVGGTALEIVGGYRDATVIRVDMRRADPTALERLRQAQVYDTPHGRFAAIPGDLIATQFEAFGGHTRNELAMVLSLLDPGDVVVDVGAHIGSFSVPIAKRVGPAGRVLAIEADPGNIELLFRNVTLNGEDDRVDIVHAVASTRDQVLQAARVSDNTGAVHFVEDPHGGWRARSVDDLCAERLGSSRPKLLKIDVEGMECAVLESARETIGRMRPLVYCEVVEAQLHRHGASVAAMAEYFREHRYALYRNQGERNSRHDRFDIVALPNLQAGGPFFDCLAVPTELVLQMVTTGKLPAAARVGP